MKKIIKLMLLIAGLTIGSFSLSAAPLFVEDFTSETVGTYLSDIASWTASGTGNANPTIANTTPLTYTSYKGGGGNYLTFEGTNGNNERYYKSFTAKTLEDGDIYYISLLLNITTASSNATYTPFTAITNGGATSYATQLFVKAQDDGYNIGISKNAATNIVFSTKKLSLGQTYLVIIKYTAIGTGTDEVMFWINPDISGEPLSSNAEASIATGNNLRTISAFNFRNAGAGRPAGNLDGIRIGFGETSALAWANLDAYTAPAVPTISVTPTELTGFTYVENNGPSAEQSFSVEGSDLTGDITITPSDNYEISETSGAGFVSTSIMLTPNAGAIASTPIYVRLKAGLAVGEYNNEEITLTSADATAKTVICNGEVTAPAVPTISVTPSVLSGFTYVENNGPSEEQSFSVEGSNLTEGITITPASDSFEISETSGTDFTTIPIILPQIDGTVAPTPIYVRLKANLSVGEYNNKYNAVTSTGAEEKSVTCNGEVTTPTGTKQATADDFSVISKKGQLIINLPQAATIEVINTQGITRIIKGKAGANAVSLPQGYYIVKVENATLNTIVH
jgi:hypothetical protein